MRGRVKAGRGGFGPAGVTPSGLRGAALLFGGRAVYGLPLPGLSGAAGAWIVCRGCPGGIAWPGGVVVVYLFRPPIPSPFPPSLSPGALTGGGKRKSRGECPGVVVLAVVCFFWGGVCPAPAGGLVFVRVYVRVRGRVRV